MSSYPDLLLQPEGHHRVLLVSLDGTEGEAGWERLKSSIEQALAELEAQGPDLPFGAVIELRSGPSEAAAGPGTWRARRSEVFLRCTRLLAEHGLALLACLREGPRGSLVMAGTRFSIGGYVGGCFGSRDEAYRWLDARLSVPRSSTQMG